MGKRGRGQVGLAVPQRVKARIGPGTERGKRLPCLCDMRRIGQHRAQRRRAKPACGLLGQRQGRRRRLSAGPWGPWADAVTCQQTGGRDACIQQEQLLCRLGQVCADQPGLKAQIQPVAIEGAAHLKRHRQAGWGATGIAQPQPYLTADQ